MRHFLLLLLICLLWPAPALAAEPAPLPDAQLLVNPANPLPSYLAPEDLTPVNNFARGNSNVMLRRDAAAALSAMLSGLKEAGITDIYVNSGYRSFVRQQELHAAKVAFYRNQGAGETAAKTLAARWVLPAGESEHQTGLAVDLSTASLGYDLNACFADTPAGIWLAEHCVEYGFIIRYTEAKEPITTVAPEPWHFRYVGIDHATYMREHDLCLEEYHALLEEQGNLQFVNSNGERRIVHFANGDLSGSLPGQLLSVSLARKYSGKYIITSIPPQEPLFDIKGHWGEQQIRRLYGMQAVGGYPDGSFHPNEMVSRGEFVTILARLPLPPFAPEQQRELPQEPLPYLDIDQVQYYYQPLQQCFRAALIQPMLELDLSPQLFQPAKALLRQETALLLAALLDSEDFALPAIPTYTDVPPPAASLFRAVEMLTARGVLQGDGLGLFYPQREISRAEICAIFTRLLDTLEAEKVPEPVPEKIPPEETLQEDQAITKTEGLR